MAGADDDALMLVRRHLRRRRPRRSTQRESDVYYFAPQKCFASDGGLWFALMSPAAIERAAEIKASGRYIPAFLDLQTAIDNSRLDQTYNTPALATILLMAEQVDWFNANGGLAWCVARTKRVGRRAVRLGRGVVVRDAVRRRPGASARSVVGTIDFDDAIDATAVAKVLRANGDRRHRALPQARPQPAARRDVPGGRAPTTSRALTACIDHVVAALS